MGADREHPTRPPAPEAATPTARRTAAPFRLPGSRWLLSTRGRLLLAVGLFVLAEALTLPALVAALFVLPYRGGPPAIQSAPDLVWMAVAVALGVPLVCSIFLYARLSQAVAHLPADRRPSQD